MAGRKLILYIATSLNGYIAKKSDDVSFLSKVEKPGEDYGYEAFIREVDTVIMGRRTYDWIMSQVPDFPHADKEAYILTRRKRPDIGKTHFYTGNMKELVNDLKLKEGKNIFVDGGAEVVHHLLKYKLIDEFIISVIPVLLGDGLRLFKEHQPEQLLELVSSKSFETGLVQVHYRKADG